MAAHPHGRKNIVKFQPELTVHRYAENIWGKIGLLLPTAAEAIPTLRAATILKPRYDYYGPNHRLQIRGPAVSQAKKAAYDVHDGRALEQSIELTGVDFALMRPRFYFRMGRSIRSRMTCFVNTSTVLARSVMLNSVIL